MLRKSLCTVVCAFFLTFPLVSVLYAQDETPTPESPPVIITVNPPPVEVTSEPPGTPALPDKTETPEDIFGLVVATLFAGAATIGGSVLVTTIVSLLKLVVPTTTASGDTLKNIVSVIVWIAYSIAIRFGFGTQFQGLATFLAPILTALVPLVGVLIGSSKLYLAAKKANVPFFGYSRTP